MKHRATSLPQLSFLYKDSEPAVSRNSRDRSISQSINQSVTQLIA